jgi:hypothetical protein
MTMKPIPYVYTILLAIGLSFAGVSFSSAQGIPGRTGIGGQIGTPSGVTLKLYQNPGFAYEFLAAWDFDNDFFLNVHGLYERPIPDSPLRYYVGPGGYIGIRTRPGRDGELTLGLSATLGVNFFVEQFEIFLQVTPRLDLAPATSGQFGGGVGLRYYF